MPTSLSFEEHGEGIGNAWTVLRDNAARAGLTAPVPTCPGWTVRALVAHQGMVHRWATGAVRGERDDDASTQVEREGLESPDLLAWLDAGVTDLLSALAFAPADLDIPFFLKDAPDPRIGWARRQSHETTIHAVDAMAAALGRPPTAAETWVHAALAVDGVDELVTGFLPRPRYSSVFPQPRTVVLRATDTGDRWTLRVGAGPVETTVGGPSEPTPEPTPVGGSAVELTGTAAQLYLGLWNRGDELGSSDPEFLAQWRSAVNVLW